MISINNVGSAGQALHYFSADNYYTQDEGLEKSTWFGKGAEILGFKGQIDKQNFLDALNGKIGGQELGKFYFNEKTQQTERDHRPGMDITFSAPKSVSLLAEVAGNREVREAHEKAVTVALTYIEKELAQTRQMTMGKLEAVETGNLMVALFRHNTSRDLDPQTHTHAVIMNATHCTDGKWRSTFNDAIYHAQRTIGAIYTSELAANIQKLGFELTPTDSKGNFEIAGVNREQIEHFSQRRAEIEAALKERGIDIHEANAQLKEDATLMTRGKKVEVDHVSLIKGWKERAKEVGINFDEIESKAAQLQKQGGITRADKLSGRQAMEFATAHLIEREAVVIKQELLRTALEHGVGRVSPMSVIKAFETLEKEGHLINLHEDHYTTAKMLGSEKWALEQVIAQKGQAPKIMSLEMITKQLDQAEQRQGFRYTQGQREAITKVMTSEDRFVAVQGLAGTGKSTMLKSLREIAQREGYMVRGMAPTGSASKIMARETGVATETVSMFLIKERQLSKDIEFTKEYAPDFARKKELWVVDESSFLSQRQKAQLDHMAIKADAKIAYLGDELQLQGVEAGKPFELAQRSGIETAYMTEINRQKTPELKTAVDMITDRDQLAEGEKLTAIELKHNERAFQYMDKAGLVQEIPNASLISAIIGEVIALGKEERERTLVITAYNQDRHAINQGVRAELQQIGEIAKKEETKEIFISKGWTRAETKEAQYYVQGDVVRFGRDYKKIEANKGEYMRVINTDSPNGIVMLKKENGSVITWEPKKYNNVEVYKAETREIAQGDLIRISRNEGIFKNGEIGRVLAVQGDIATLEVKQGQEMNQYEVNLARSKHWDYAYSSTVHFAQGATQYRTLFHISTPENAN
jgi:conjugative relaxase-like TrwC/TraI family protein